MLNALNQITAAGVFAGVFKVAERFVFAVRSGASLDVNFKKHAVVGIPFKFYDLLCCAGDSLEGADCNRRAAALCHFQMPHAANDRAKLGQGRGDTYPLWNVTARALREGKTHNGWFSSTGEISGSRFQSYNLTNGWLLMTGLEEFGLFSGAVSVGSVFWAVISHYGKELERARHTTDELQKKKDELQKKKDELQKETDDLEAARQKELADKTKEICDLKTEMAHWKKLSNDFEARLMEFDVRSGRWYDSDLAGATSAATTVATILYQHSFYSNALTGVEFALSILGLQNSGDNTLQESGITMLKAQILAGLNRIDEALKIAREIAARALPDDLALWSRRLIIFITGLKLGKPGAVLEDAKALAKSYEGSSLFGYDHVDTFVARTLVLELLFNLDDPDALESAKAVVKDMEESQQVGRQHHKTLQARFVLVKIIAKLANTRDSKEALEEALNEVRNLANDMESNDSFGASHKETLATQFLEASIIARLGNFLEALPIANRVVDGFEALVGPQHPDTLMVREFLADIQHRVGRI